MSTLTDLCVDLSMYVCVLSEHTCTYMVSHIEDGVPEQDSLTRDICVGALPIPQTQLRTSTHRVQHVVVGGHRSTHMGVLQQHVVS
jgi:hypothetical protein